jgi:hypothetical protein
MYGSMACGGLHGLAGTAVESDVCMGDGFEVRLLLVSRQANLE